ncbi:t-SNARE [Dichotomopilus funicola]|uniref:t-SNARE affecting a late Golgi compartment protein 1 n=1 Tax=Dichotomopilus funicola TaxID=1934379 RepID=A0AAN6ZKY9_9PEZI|nr:t-SNARE [Dichotomopilus funicola]
MSSTNEEDPFLQVQQDVLTQLQTARSLFTSYLRIRSLTTSPTSPELTSARTDLEASLATLAEDLADLVESVKAVESNPAQYGISPTEMGRRKRLVQEVGGEVDDMHEELAKASGSSSRKGRPGARGGAGSDLPDPSAFAIPDGETDANNSNPDYAAEFELEQQEVMMREQDQHLDGVLQTVGNIRRQADDMGRELEEQVEMLDHTERLVESLGGRLQMGMDKLKYVARRSEDKWSSCCIGVLIVVLLILLVLLLIL